MAIMKRIHIMLDPESLAWLKELTANGASRSWIIRDAVRRHYFALKKDKQQFPTAKVPTFEEPTVEYDQ